MILLTVGTQLPFDRLVKSVDEWASSHEAHIIGQIGSGVYLPKHLEYRDFYPADELSKLFEAAQLIIAHAGIGSIISALTYAKPIVVVPRRASYGEHRNDHQLATAKKFEASPGIRVAYDISDLAPAIDDLLGSRDSSPLSPFASEHMLLNLKALLLDSRPPKNGT